jgi:hypothetical protein
VLVEKEKKNNLMSFLAFEKTGCYSVKWEELFVILPRPFAYILKR